MRLRLSKALLGVAEAQTLAAESTAIERGVATERIGETVGLALHTGAFNGIPVDLIGTGLGMLASRRPYGRFDLAVNSAALICYAVPAVEPEPEERTRPTGAAAMSPTGS